MECKVKKFCVVGIGTHASTKLIPALRQSNQHIVGVISSQDVFDFNFIGPVFRTMEEAIAKTPSDTIFLITSPPKLHFSQTAKALKSGRSVIIEKPAFICRKDAEEASFLATERQLVMAEAWMYKFSKVYSKLILEWVSSKEKITSLDMVFTIPEFPRGTFRDSRAFGNSIIFDIGSYPTSLMADLGISLRHFDIVEAKFEGSVMSSISVKVRDLINDVNVRFQVGIAETYQNYVNINYDDGRSRKYTFFFYGRPGVRQILDRSSAGIEEIVNVKEKNSFCTMLSQPLCVWHSDQAVRFKKMITTTSFLSALESVYYPAS